MDFLLGFSSLLMHTNEYVYTHCKTIGSRKQTSSETEFRSPEKVCVLVLEFNEAETNVL